MGNVIILSDFVGSADVAMAVSRGVLTRMGHRALCLPTALISGIWSQGTPAELDTTDYLRAALESWERQGIRADGVLIGYLAGEAQAEFLAGQCARWREAGAKIFLDPVFADNGRLYRGIGQERLALLRDMLKWADYVLPNATEAEFLTGLSEPVAAAGAICRMGAGSALITGAGGNRVVLANREGTHTLPYEPVPGSFSGAGDAFSAAFAGGILQGMSARCSAGHAISCVKQWLTRAQNLPELRIGLPMEMLF